MNNEVNKIDNESVYVCNQCGYETYVNNNKFENKRCPLCKTELSESDITNNKKPNRGITLVNSGRGKAC